MYFKYHVFKYNLLSDVLSIFSGSTQGFINGPVSGAKFNSLSGIYYRNNKLYVSDTYGQIRQVTFNYGSDWIDIMGFNNTSSLAISGEHSLYSGTVPPTPSTGTQVDGQYYLDTNTRILYKYSSSNYCIFFDFTNHDLRIAIVS